MKQIKQGIIFLGSVNFAMILLGLAIISVVIGTMTESYADSHIYAANIIYHHPLFNGLLSLFFVNILISALLRFPFKRKHIPFLLTHLGLLMVIGGTMVKNLGGLQGHLFTWEGTGSHTLIIPHQPSIQLISNNGDNPLSIPLSKLKKGWTRLKEHPEMRWRLAAYAPHVIEKYETWIKNDLAYIRGFPPFLVHEWSPLQPLPIFEPLQLDSQQKPWMVIAIKTDDVETAAKTLYLHQLKLHIQTKQPKLESLEIDVKHALDTPIPFGGGKLTTTLEFNEGRLHFLFKDDYSSYTEEQIVHLTDFNKYLSIQSPFLKSSYTINLRRPDSLLAMIDDPEDMLTIWAFNQQGQIFKEPFSSTTLGSLIVYDKGFGGYAIQTHIPLALSQEIFEQHLYKNLKPLLADDAALSPPLKILKLACDQAQVDFTQTFIHFFQAWNQSQTLLLNSSTPALSPILPHLQWNLLSYSERQACLWINRLFHQLSFSLRQGEELIPLLKKYHWPFINQLQTVIDRKEMTAVFPLLAKQIFSIVSDLPILDDQAHPLSILSAYFQLYGMDASLLDSIDIEVPNQYITLETSLTNQLIPMPPPLKVEDQRPGIVLEVEKNKWVQKIPLAFSPAGQGLLWPINQGKHQIRFQPQTLQLPYHIRLKQARQLTYPQSPQTFSYEADIHVTDVRKDLKDFFTLSMNHVYETWDGYRFYLSSVQGSPETIKQVQIAINYDPAKYLLTYPGAGLLFLGIGLLFWLRPYRKKN